MARCTAELREKCAKVNTSEGNESVKATGRIKTKQIF